MWSFWVRNCITAISRENPQSMTSCIPPLLLRDIYSFPFSSFAENSASLRGSAGSLSAVAAEERFRPAGRVPSRCRCRTSQHRSHIGATLLFYKAHFPGKSQALKWPASFPWAMGMLIDIHSHLDHPRFLPDIDAVISRAKAAGVRHIVTNGIDPRTNRICLELPRNHLIGEGARATSPRDAPKREREPATAPHQAAGSGPLSGASRG